MAQRRRRSEEVDESSSEGGDDVFSDIDAAHETDLTSDDDDDASDNDDNNDDLAQTQDQSDLADLFADNEHPPEYYIHQLENFDETIYNQEDYSPGTTRMLDRVEECWNGFCSYTRRDPVASYSTLSAALLSIFLEWVLNLRRGKGGRRLRGIKTQSSLQTFWKVFRLVHERATGDKIDPVTTRQMKRVIRHLSKKYRLKKKGREKPTMDVEDLAKVVETTVVTTRKNFGHGRHRIELCLFLQLAGLTTNRPQAILDLCYRHIRVTLLRDPCGGPHRILIEFTFEFTKEFLGAKDENTFPLPEIIFDPSLVLSPHVFLLALIFADRAFRRVNGEEVLVSAEQLLLLDIPPGCNELPLLLDPDLDDIPIFRQSVRTPQGIEISPDQALPYSTLLPWVQKMGALTSFRQVAGPYTLRRGAAKALDNSGQVSDSLRNLMMHHADTRTFLQYYLDRRIDKDVAGIIRGLKPQEELMRAACRMSRTIDPNRPQELTTAQSLSVNQLPEIQDLVRRRDDLGRRLGRPLARHKGTVEYDLHQQLTRELSGAHQRARDALLKKVQEKYDQEQPMLEVQRQLSGVKLSESVNHCLEQSEEMSLPLKRLSAALLTLPRPTLEEEMLRRTEAIDAGAAYCLFEEGDTCRIAHDKRQSLARNVDERETNHETAPKIEMVVSHVRSPQEVKLQEAIRLVTMPRPRDSNEKVQRPRLCFLCVGNPNLDNAKRVQTFKAHGDVTKHIKHKHLKHIVEGKVLSCGICGETFLQKMHLQRHAIDAHSTVT